MDTPQMLLGKNNHKSLGTLRLSGSPKTPHRDVVNVMCTPPSSKYTSSPNTTPKMMKNAFLAENSPSQSYDYSSPSRLSQEFDLGDVGWEWGDKTSLSKNSRAHKTDEEKTRRQENKIKRLQHKQVRKDSRRDDPNKGFYKFKIEVEQLFQRSLNDERNSKESQSAPAKGYSTEYNENTDCLSNKNSPVNADLNFVNSPTAKENQTHSCNLLDNSEIDALLLEASQNVEEHIVKTELTKNGTKDSTPKGSELVNIIEISSDGSKGTSPNASEIADIDEIVLDGNSVDEVLLSICDDELMQLTNVGILSATQKDKTSFSRYNSMPPQLEEKMPKSSTTKSFIRHSSMPSNNATNSSGLGTGTGTPKLNDQKRICTKEEVEKKKLEAKKRQLLSQQRRLLLNSKNKSLVLR